MTLYVCDGCGKILSYGRMGFCNDSVTCGDCRGRILSELGQPRYIEERELLGKNRAKIAKIFDVRFPLGMLWRRRTK